MEREKRRDLATSALATAGADWRNRRNSLHNRSINCERMDALLNVRTNRVGHASKHKEHAKHAREPTDLGSKTGDSNDPIGRDLQTALSTLTPMRLPGIRA